MKAITDQPETFGDGWFAGRRRESGIGSFARATAIYFQHEAYLGVTLLSGVCTAIRSR